MEITKTMAIGHIMKKLIEEGITDFDKVADTLQQLKDLQNQEGLWPYDRYTESGSDSEASVITEATQEKQDCIVWCLNHYLAMNRNPRVIQRAKEALEKFGTGCGTSAISGGMNSLHKALEVRIAKMLNKEKAILFPTGYTANLGAISAIVGKNDLILFDHESHASIIDGSTFSGKKWLAFHHNDVENLEAKLARYIPKYENIFVMIESAYSMSGDLAPIKEIAALKKKYKFILYVDEAHTFGMYGPNGSGYCVEQGVEDEVDFIMSTLSKSTASVGGFIATKRKYCTLMQAYSRPYIFQACLSPAAAAAALASLDEISENPSILEILHTKTAFFRGRLKEIGFDLGASQSPAVPFYVKDPKILLNISKELYENGIFSVSVAYPAVPIDKGRIRFTVNLSHTQDHLEKTIRILEKLGKKYHLI